MSGVCCSSFRPKLRACPTGEQPVAAPALPGAGGRFGLARCSRFTQPDPLVVPCYRLDLASNFCFSRGVVLRVGLL